VSAGRRTAIHLFLMVAIGAVLGLLGPFGSGSMAGGARLFFWIAFVVGGYLIFRPVTTVADWLVAGTAVPRWLATILTALVASVPLSALIGFALGGMRVTDFWFGARFPILYAQVAAIGIGIHLLMMTLFAERAAPAPPAPAPSPGPDAEAGAAAAHPFLRRLPPALGTELMCLEMQDHYLRAQTRLGSTLLLMRFRDAVEELGELGLAVHRSWWVAHQAVAGLEQDGRSLHLRLADGTRVPVSRANAAEVRAAVRLRFDSPPPPAKSPDQVAGASRPA
jgi:hypothetical protein